MNSDDTVLDTFNGPFNAATVVVSPNGPVIESDVTNIPGNDTGYTLSADFWSWNLNGYVVPIDFGSPNGVDVSAKVIPLPAAAWFFLTARGGLGLVGARRRGRDPNYVQSVA